MAKAFDYDIELDEQQLAEDVITRDNILAIRRSLEKITEILEDIDRRLENGGL